MTSEHAYPRPQLRRGQWTNLNGIWDFAIDKTAQWQTPADVSFDREILVPFAPETSASGIGNTSFFCACWYRRVLRFKPRPGERVLLHCEAVDEVSSVWVNGTWLGQREGGYTRQSWDITDALASGGEQEIVLRAFDDPHDLHKPRGKQDWLENPHIIWYQRTTGIWQTVWLEVVPQVRVESLRWGCSLERFEISLDAALSAAAPEGASLRVVLRLKDRVLVDDRIGVQSDAVSRVFRLPDPGIEPAREDFLWCPERPHLIDAELILEDAGGAVLDRVESYTALRSIEVRNGRYELNGLSYYMRLVLDQGYWPNSGMTAPDDEALARDVRLCKEMGFNGVRKHQKIESERFLYWADVLGLLVWEELPSAYAYSARTVRKLTHVWTQAIERDRNHPCIITWVPFNESWAVPDLPRDASQRSAVNALHHLTKALDGSRPVTGNDGWEIDQTDLIGIHDYEADPNALFERLDSSRSGWKELLAQATTARRRVLLEPVYAGQPVLLTEFGGIKLDEGKNSWGYSVATSSEDLKRRYVRLLRSVRAIPALSGFCYTQLTDTYQEANGLLTMEREPKFSTDVIALATRGPRAEEERQHENQLCSMFDS